MKMQFKDFEQLEAALDLLQTDLQWENQNLILQVEKGDALEVSCHENQAVLRCKERIHIFRALGLLLQKLEAGEKDFDIKEDIYFEQSGVMFDVSRNAVLTLDTLKRLLRYMAVMGLNTAYLYMEDIYEVKEYPYFGYMRGRYSFEDLQELDRYAQQFGIEIVPCIQTLGHMEATLRWPYAQDMKDTDNVLMAGEEKTYQFLDALIRSSSKPFRSKKIHLGMDEAWLLGAGNYQKKNGFRDSFSIMVEHLNKVVEISNRYGLKPTIWSDMFFRLGSKTQDYYDPKIEFPKDLKGKIPENVTLSYWDYYHTRPEEYELYLKKHQEISSKIAFAGGIWLWHGMAPKHTLTVLSTNSALSVCKKHGVKEVMATIWGDNGAEVNIMTALYGMQLYAEHTYHQNPTEQEVKDRFAFCIHESPENYISLAKLDEWPGIKAEPWQESSANPSKWLLWQDILCGLFDKHLPDFNLKAYYQDLAEAYNKAKAASKNFKLVYDFSEKLAKVLSLKGDLGVRIKAVYDKKDIAGLKAIAETELYQLKELVSELRFSHRKLWLSTNKAFGFDVLDIRYGGLLARIDTAQYRLNQLVQGKLLNLEELEQEKLPFVNQGIPAESRYAFISTVSPVI